MASGEQRAEQEEKPTTSGRRAKRAMPSDEIIRNSIAQSMTQILVNMSDPELQQQCRELLQVDDLLHGAHIRILAHLEHIDAQREQREREAKERKERRQRRASADPKKSK
ncbi:hypothetical protein KR222_000347 [Zaprionus bogoriensis]|nr:hypothetical protein KR222_000347 [Zaprionus bogoriensis]